MYSDECFENNLEMKTAKSIRELKEKTLYLLGKDIKKMGKIDMDPTRASRMSFGGNANADVPFLTKLKKVL